MRSFPELFLLKFAIALLAVDPLGFDVRRRADGRAYPRRIRRGDHGVVQPSRDVANADAAGVGPAGYFPARGRADPNAAAPDFAQRGGRPRGR